MLYLWLLPLRLPLLLAQNVEQSRNVVTLANGITAFNKKNYLIASEILNQYLNEKDNRNFWARYYLGLSLYHLGFVEEAILQWQNIITLGLGEEFASKKGVREKINQLYDVNLKKMLFYPRSFVKKSDTRFSNEFNFLKIPLGLYLNDGKLYFVEFKNGNFSQINLNDQKIASVNVGQSYFNALRNPWDLLIDGKFFIVSDFGNDKLFVFNQKNDSVSTIGKRGYKDGELLGPKGLALDNQKNIYVSESGNSRIQVFNKQGEHLFKFGKLGKRKGEFKKPSGVIYDDKDDSLYVLDSGNQRVQKFNQKGEYLAEWGKGFLKNPNDFILNGDKMFILDERQIYYQDLVSGENFPLLKNDPSINDLFLSMAYDPKEHLFYVSTVKNNKIEIFNSISDSYQNLQISFDTIILDKFPQVFLGVKVNNFYNHPINFLKKGNFMVYENGVKLFHEKQETIKEKRLILLVEKSSSERGHLRKTRKFLDGFFSLVRENDLVQVVTFGNQNRDGFLEKTRFNSLPSFSAKKVLERENWSNLKINQALNKSISNLLNHLGKKAIVILAYQKYGISAFGSGSVFKELSHYAKNNNIPIYVFYLGDTLATKGLTTNNFLYNLTETSEGEFYVYNDSRKVRHFYQHLDENGNNVYYLQYLTARNPPREGKLRRVKVEVEYLDQKGVEDLIVYPIPSNPR